MLREALSQLIGCTGWSFDFRSAVNYVIMYDVGATECIRYVFKKGCLGGAKIIHLENNGISRE
jgi:hypothetical protein